MKTYQLGVYISGILVKERQEIALHEPENNSTETYFPKCQQNNFIIFGENTLSSSLLSGKSSI